MDAISLSVPCASDVREGFTLKTALSEKLQAAIISHMTAGFVEAIGFSVLCTSNVREGFMTSSGGVVLAEISTGPLKPDWR